MRKKGGEAWVLDRIYPEGQVGATRRSECVSGNAGLRAGIEGDPMRREMVHLTFGASGCSIDGDGG